MSNNSDVTTGFLILGGIGIIIMILLIFIGFGYLTNAMWNRTVYNDPTSGVKSGYILPFDNYSYDVDFDISKYSIIMIWIILLIFICYLLYQYVKS